VSEWVSDAYTPNEQFVNCMVVRISYILVDDDDYVPFILETLSLRQQSTCKHVSPPQHIILIPNQPDFPLTVLLDATGLAEKHEIPML
jgi:hypothetical protein